MPEEEGAEEKLAYSGKLLRVVVRQTSRGWRELVEHPGAVAVLVTDAQGRVLLVRQHREGAGRELWEIPAGTLEIGEKPYACAKRELREETGLTGKLRYLGVIYPTPGYSTERIFLFQLVGTANFARADHEVEEARFFSVPEIMELARKGKGDGKTLAALAFFLAQNGG